MYSLCLNGYSPRFIVGDSGTEGFSAEAESDLGAAEVSELFLVTAVRGRWMKALDSEPDCSWDAWDSSSFAPDVPAKVEIEYNNWNQE